MGYSEALEAAGAKVLLFEKFGSYQGDWWAKVILNGKTGWIHGSYGSCSGCDSFEAEFGWGNENCEEHRYENKELTSQCKECQKERKKYQRKLAGFGKYYTACLLTQEKALNSAKKHLDWDLEAEKMVNFIEMHK